MYISIYLNTLLDFVYIICQIPIGIYLKPLTTQKDTINLPITHLNFQGSCNPDIYMSSKFKKLIIQNKKEYILKVNLQFLTTRKELDG